MATETKPDMPPQAVQAYKDATDNLIYLKREQLQIIYYTILVLAAIYILAKPETASANLRAFFIFCTAGLTFFSIWKVWEFQLAIKKFRIRLAQLYDEFFTETQRSNLCLEASKDESALLQPTPWLYTVICAVAGGVNTYLLL